METFKGLILKHITRRDYTPVKLDKLAENLGIDENNREKFKQAAKELQNEGKTKTTANGQITLPPMGTTVIGKFTSNPRGFGFVIPLDPNAHGDLYIPRGGSAGAMTGDIVEARPQKKGRRDGQTRYNGQIIDIIERSNERLVGTLKKYYNKWSVEPDGSDFIAPIEVQDASAKNAREGQKVVIEIIDYPCDDQPARGVITEVLGKAGQYDVEIRSCVVQFDLPEEFPEECIKQARNAAHSFDPDQPDKSRDDITDKILITIDPDDAKDFDDAISLEKTKDGNWLLGVHIADVSEFVPQHSPLDVEARQRGNSTYLPGKVIPMLPEILSNGICSLQPQQKRFAKSVYTTYDPAGKILGREYANSLIKSHARLTYRQADDILKNKPAEADAQAVTLLKDMETLALAIEKRRRKNGMIHLDLPEAELIYDENGRVIDAEPADDSYPHTIIEMFMVEANEAVAELLDRFGVPFMRRIHPDPETSNLKTLNQFTKICGLKLPRILERSEIQNLLKTAKGKPFEYAINIYVLRSLQRAEYSPAHIGHFALASKHYCHFTSPIRRYADLLVHRLFDCYVKGTLNKIGLEEVLPEQKLNEIGKHITFTENRSDEAEKDLKKVLILQMLTGRLGSEMETVVSGLTNFGIFAQCKKYQIEGLIEFGDLGMDEWDFDSKSMAVVGRHSGKSIRLGEPLKTKIASISIPARQLFLTPAEPLVKNRQTNNSRKSKSSRGRKNRNKRTKKRRGKK